MRRMTPSRPTRLIWVFTSVLLLLACGSAGSPLAELANVTTTPSSAPPSTELPVTSSAAPSTTTTTLAARATTTTTLEPHQAEFVTWARDAGARSLDTQTVVKFGNTTCELAVQGTSVLYSFWAVQLNNQPALVRSQVLAVMGAAGIKLCPDHLATIQPAIQRLAGN